MYAQVSAKNGIRQGDEGSGIHAYHHDFSVLLVCYLIKKPACNVVG